MKIFVQLLFGMFIMNGVSAQTSGTVSVGFTLPLVAMLDIEGGSGIALNLSAPSEAGNPVAVPAANTALWLNFTSAVTPSLSRQVTVQMSGSLPLGIGLGLLATGPSGSGAGARGSAGAQVTLTGSAQTLINGIGGAYTGNGLNNGYNLSYTALLQNYTQLRAGSEAVTVVFTLMDN